MTSPEAPFLVAAVRVLSYPLRAFTDQQSSDPLDAPVMAAIRFPTPTTKRPARADTRRASTQRGAPR